MTGGREETEEEMEEIIRRGNEERCEKWRRGVEVGFGSGDGERERWGGIVEDHVDEELEVEELGDAEVVREEGEGVGLLTTATATVGEGGGEDVTDGDAAGGGGEGPGGGSGSGLGRVVGGWFGVFGRR